LSHAGNLSGIIVWEFNSKKSFYFFSLRTKNWKWMR
jgi:hypothetical protein